MGTAAIADTCSTDLKYCNDTQICIQATRGVGKNDLANKVRLEPNRVWSTAPLYSHFVTAAKARGLDCGVMEAPKQTGSPSSKGLYRCETNPKICSQRDLCEKGKNSNVHRSEIQRRNLNCPADSNERKKQRVFIHLNGNWSGTIKCSNQIFPFDGIIKTSNTQKSIELITRNYTYSGTFTLNKFSNRIFVNAKRSDGNQFRETFTYSIGSNTFEGQTSSGCYLKASKGRSNPDIFSFDRKDFAELNTTQRKQFQYALKQLGYYQSSVDGLYGPKTENAARAYAQAKRIKNGYPESLYKRLVSEVNVPSSFAISKKPTNIKRGSTQSTSNSNNGQAIAKGLFAIIACSATPNPSACLSGVAGNKPNTNNGRSVDVFSDDNSCSRDGNCGYNEICVKKPGMTRGLCMGKPSGVGRNWSPQSCTRDTQCVLGARCDRTYKICVER